MVKETFCATAAALAADAPAFDARTHGCCLTKLYSAATQKTASLKTSSSRPAAQQQRRHLLKPGNKPEQSKQTAAEKTTGKDPLDY